MTGLFKHFKGAFYRALFTVEWIAGSRPAPDDELSVVMVDSVWLGIHKDYPATSGMYFDLLKARWSGNSDAVVPVEHVVVYISLSVPGRVSARTKAEFTEKVVVDNRLVSRFERIAD